MTTTQQTILAAKLYKASPRQGQIQATMSNPNNAGLMTQLAQYLDKKYRTAENLTGKSKEELKTEKSEKQQDENSTENKGFIRESGSSGGSHGGGGGHIAGLPDDMSLVDVPTSENDLSALEESMGGDEGGSESSSEEPAEAATELEPIEACTNIQVETIKSSLNNVAESAGVQRVAIKNNELWIYYDDDKNLNNIMTSVIDFLLKAGYANLEFNRLARSDNAIVFEIIGPATLPEVKKDEE